MNQTLLLKPLGAFREIILNHRHLIIISFSVILLFILVVVFMAASNFIFLKLCDFNVDQSSVFLYSC